MRSTTIQPRFCQFLSKIQPLVNHDSTACFMVSITAKVSHTDHERFLQIGRQQFGCENSFQFANFLVQKVLSGELAIIKDNATLQLKAIQQAEMLTALNEELQKAKTLLPDLAYKKGYADAETNFKKKAGATALKAEFYDLNLANRNGGCGVLGGCIFGRTDVKQQISYIKTISDYERRNGQ